MVPYDTHIVQISLATIKSSSFIPSYHTRLYAFHRSLDYLTGLLLAPDCPQFLHNRGFLSSYKPLMH